LYSLCPFLTHLSLAIPDAHDGAGAINSGHGSLEAECFLKDDAVSC